MQEWLWGLTVALYSIAAGSSGLNAGYFGKYRTLRRRRRLGAWVMASTCFALSAESTYAGLNLLAAGPDHGHPITGLAVSGLLAASALAVSLLILRQRLGQ